MLYKYGANRMRKAEKLVRRKQARRAVKRILIEQFAQLNVGIEAVPRAILSNP